MKNKDVKIFIGPMSKNIVDAVIEFTLENQIQLALIPSRRQVENCGGYVNNWTSKDFCEYVRKKNKNILLVRDHAGPSQGDSEDDGFESFDEDCKLFDIIHIDVWKKYKMFEDGINATVSFIKRGLNLNPNLFFEIGTEESIRKFSISDLTFLVEELKNKLNKKEFQSISHIVVQSGTALHANSNIGIYNSYNLLNMCNLAKNYGLLAKEHNGDYLEPDLISNKFTLGLDCINIAPEFGQIETSVVLEEIANDSHLLEIFYELCLKSNRWQKWFSSDFEPSKNKVDLIKVSGHYVFSEPDFEKIKNQLPQEIDMKIKSKIKSRIESLVNITYIEKNH